MPTPRTLLEMAGADLEPADFARASLVLIDFQNEYLRDPLAITGAEEAVGTAKNLVAEARRADAPVIHIAHAGPPGGLFDRGAERGQFIADLAPASGETVIEKRLPNGFAGTSLDSVLSDAARKDILICGFMTHMCVSSTARAALDLGFRVTIDAAGCGTRDLPDGRGGVIEARTVHETSLAALADRFAVIAWR